MQKHQANECGFKSVRYLEVPSLSSAKKSGNYIKVSWKKSAGAKGYYVYRKTAGGHWKQIGKTKSLTYTDKTPKKGVTYYYTVRAYYNSFKSSYMTKGVSAKV